MSDVCSPEIPLGSHRPGVSAQALTQVCTSLPRMHLILRRDCSVSTGLPQGPFLSRTHPEARESPRTSSGGRVWGSGGLGRMDGSIIVEVAVEVTQETAEGCPCPCSSRLDRQDWLSLFPGCCVGSPFDVLRKLTHRCSSVGKKTAIKARTHCSSIPSLWASAGLVLRSLGQVLVPLQGSGSLP